MSDHRDNERLDEPATTAQERWAQTPIRDLPPVPISDLGDLRVNPDREQEDD